MGMQIPCCFYTKVQEESPFGVIRKELKDVFHRLATQKGCKIEEGHLMAGSCPYDDLDPAQTCGSEHYRVYQGQKALFG